MNIEYNVILGVSIVFNIAAILFLGHLISFHIFLQSKHLSTYEYLQLKQNKLHHKSKIFRQVNRGNERPDSEDEPIQVEIENNDNNLDSNSARSK